ncbi:hypothetical protein LO771_27795 [Streptacidiphilus sp. ASG 303]|uniref:hypothetical protein n=1 Tax=Streptacidiphilus sp. ASG 303 TaxID=2896847 RepID=UPI001E6141C3|nr:hypothetical protein [Streptacidiphilus sp. ASG 303]MCD0486082.1 hypothetical protein [Streptacidiphilus sp. ASG 303]
MDLRPELLPPPVSRRRLDELALAVEWIEALLDRGERAQAQDAVVAFNAVTGHTYTLDDFATWSGWRSLEEFACEAARPARPKVPGVTRAELAEIARRTMGASPETDYYLRLLEANVPHPRVGDLVFHPPAELLGASAEAVVDAALGYRAIAL